MGEGKVVVVGTGMMGPGIAACAALAGHPTALVGRSREKAAAGRERAIQCVGQLRDNGLVTPEQASRAPELIEPEDDQARAVGGALLVIESISENLAAKQELFARLSAALEPGAMMVSNTSSLPITEIARDAVHPERTATTHFWLPPHLIPLVEIVMGAQTAEATANRLKDLLTGWGKAPVIVRRDVPGQLANRLLQAMIREAANIVATGLASAQDVDTAVKMGMGLRFPAWGPLEHVDAVGIDLACTVQGVVLPDLDNRPTPSPNLKRLLEEGHLGYKSGQGFYNWREKDMDALRAGRDRFIIEALRILRGGRAPGPGGS